MAEILAGESDQATKDLTELETRIYPYNSDRLLEYETRGAELWLALRRNDVFAARRILAHLSETAGRISPVFARNLVRLLICCEKQTNSDSFKKQIRE